MESHKEQCKPPLKVAIIGSGLAGLTTAFLLTGGEADVKQHLHVELLERSSTLGMDSESVTVERHGQKRRVDVPMRAFSQGFYPELVKLYRHLHIPFAPMSFTFSFGASPASATKQQGPTPSFLYSGFNIRRPLKLELPDKSFLQSVSFIFKTLWSYMILIVAVSYHVKAGHTRDSKHRVRKITFGEWCDHSWVYHSFFSDLLLPMLCSIMTADHTAVRSIPAAEMLDYLFATFLNRHYTVQGGVSQVVQALTANMSADQIHLGVNVKDLIPMLDGDETRITLVCEDRISGLERRLEYDHIIFASQASQSAKMLRQLCGHLDRNGSQSYLQHCEAQINQLSKFHYVQSTVICHTDASILAPEKEAWKELNFVRPIHTGKADPTYTMATHVIYQEQDYVFMQTTNPLPWLLPHEDTWISKSEFERFVLTLSGREARRAFFDFEVSNGKDTKQPKLGILQGSGSESLCETKMPSIWFCGSWSYGVPLLEGTVHVHLFQVA